MRSKTLVNGKWQQRDAHGVAGEPIRWKRTARCARIASHERQIFTLPGELQQASVAPEPAAFHMLTHN